MNCNAVYVLFESKAPYPNTPLYMIGCSTIKDIQPSLGSVARFEKSINRLVNEEQCLGSS